MVTPLLEKYVNDSMSESESDLEIVLVCHVGIDSNPVKNILREAEQARVKRRKMLQHNEFFQESNRNINISDLEVTGTEFLPAIVMSESDPDDADSGATDLKCAAGTVMDNSYETVGGEPKSAQKRSLVSPEQDLKPSELEFMDAIHLTDFPKSCKGSLRSDIRLLCDLSDPSEIHSSKNTDVVSLVSIIGSQDLLETYQFNFSVQLPMFLSFLHESFVKKYKKIVFVTGDSIFESPKQRSDIQKKFNISEAMAPLPNKFASHHTKMMVNFYENGDAEIVIMTCNLTHLDICGLTQALWKSGKLPRGSTSSASGKRFRLDLLRYLSRYRLTVTKSLISTLEKYDFSSVDVELIASAPGLYNIREIQASAEYYGYAKLRQVLCRNNLLIESEDCKHNILSQVTSIAYPYASNKGKTSSVFSHLLCPLMFKSWQRILAPGEESFENHQLKHNYRPHIIFPTKEDVCQSQFGYLSGCALHFKHRSSLIHKAQYEQNIKKYLCKWRARGNTTGREYLTPHVKYYACDNGDNWRLLKWVMIGSHNLSKQAWGYPKPKSDGCLMNVASYELSVLIPQEGRKLCPSYKADTLEHGNGKPVRFPFSIPPEPYKAHDEPWSSELL